MNAGRDVERLIATWLAEEAPVSSPDSILVAAHRTIERTNQRRALRTPWRPIQMNRPVLFGAAAAIALVLIGGSLLLRPGTNTAAVPSSIPSLMPTSIPSSQPSAFGGGVGVLAQTFRSSRYGYVVRIPADWTATPAATDWKQGTRTLWGDPALDVLQGPNGRLVAASQQLPAGQSADQWFVAYCQADGTAPDVCARYRTSWAPILIGATGYVTLDGVPALGGTILPGGPIFDAVAIANDRAYEFTLDGAVTRADFDRLLASVAFGPTYVLTKPFDSPFYRYRIWIDPSWAVTPATLLISDPKSTDQTCCDQIAVHGTDTTLANSADALGSRSFDAWLADHHADAKAGVPAGCDGGDPSTWPVVPVGDQNGRLMQLCNAAEVDVNVGDHVFMFSWGNSTFDNARHMDEEAWKSLLAKVDFSTFEASASAPPSASTR